MKDPFDSPEWRDFARRAEEQMVPKLKDSAISATLWDGKIDSKIAIELGYAVLLGKPLMLLVTPGTPIPETLRRASDSIVEVYLEEMGDPKTAKRIQEEMTRVLKKRGIIE